MRKKDKLSLLKLSLPKVVLREKRVNEVEERLDRVFDLSFDVNHPAMLDYVELKFQLKRLRNSILFYKSRIEELERNLSKFPEPYKTMISNILANGRIKA